MTLGSFHSTKTSENVCGNGGKWNGNFPGKFAGGPRIVEFPTRRDIQL